MKKRRVTTWRVSVRTAILAVMWAPSGLAQDAAGAAQLLFEQGRDLLRAGNTAEACPMLEESQRLDPANGTLLALAMCHEAEGQLASAWEEYTSVVALAKRDGQTEREEWSSERAAALRPRLSTLELRVPEAVRRLPRLKVTNNGVLLPSGGWNLAMPVDGGEYHITAGAEGYRLWETTIVVTNEGHHQVQVVPMLEVESPPPVSEEPAVTAPELRRVTLSREPQAAPSSSDELSTSQTVGVASMGLGLAGWLASGALTIAMLRKDAEADKCTGLCRQGRQEEAVRYGNWATGMGVAGTAAIAAGAALYLWTGDADAAPSVAHSVAPTVAHVEIDVARQSVGLAVNGSF